MSAKKTNSSKQNANQVVKKRDQIASSNRTMFFWVAGASVLVSFAVVASIFLIKQLVFNERVLGEKAKTSSILKKDISSVKQLHRSVNQLRADKRLTGLRSAGSTNNLDVVLDALPYEGDAVAFGSSLQSILLVGSSIESLTVDPAVQESDADLGQSAPISSVDITSLTAVGTAQPITFSFKISGSENDLRNMFKKLNSSLRPIKIIVTELQSSGGGRVEVVVQAVTYYQPKKVFELTQKAIKP